MYVYMYGWMDGWMDEWMDGERTMPVTPKLVQIVSRG